jgi:hypothetical protein
MSSSLERPTNLELVIAAVDHDDVVRIKT